MIRSWGGSCKPCLSSRRFKAEQARRLWDGALTFPDIAKRCRCKQCGRTASKASPAWRWISRGGGDPQPLVPKAWGRLPD